MAVSRTCRHASACTPSRIVRPTPSASATWPPPPSPCRHLEGCSRRVVCTWASVSGNNVTLRWDRPAIGPVPTGFQVAGGVAPGQTLAAIPTGSRFPIFSLVAPTGSFFVRTNSFDGALASVASNEVPLHVNVPVPPSAPGDLVGLANGSGLTLAWRNTFGGAPPSSLLLDVTGSIATTLPLGVTDGFAYPTVPPGTYTFRLRAANAAGVSAASNPVTLSFPARVQWHAEPAVSVPRLQRRQRRDRGVGPGAHRQCPHGLRARGGWRILRRVSHHGSHVEWRSGSRHLQPPRAGTECLRRQRFHGRSVDHGAPSGSPGHATCGPSLPGTWSSNCSESRPTASRRRGRQVSRITDTARRRRSACSPVASCSGSARPLACCRTTPWAPASARAR
jgi:hypothetical protein